MTSFYFDWAQFPPVSYRIEFHNGSGSDTIPAFYDPTTATVVSSQDPVEVAIPFDIESAADVVPYTSNTTLVTLDEAVPVGGADGPRYATLYIRGNQGIVGENKFNSSEPGGEVAEWGIIVDDGSTRGQDLSGAVFNKGIGRRSVIGNGENMLVTRSMDQVRDQRSTRAVVVGDEARDAVLAKYGRYMRRSAHGDNDRQRRRR